jgi:phage shock protein A
MLGRMWSYIKLLFPGKLDQREDPAALLQQAARELREHLEASRQRAINAITQRNNLKALLDEQEEKASQLEAQAESALRKGDRDLALRLLREKLTFDEINRKTRASYDQAVEAAEAVKLAIRRQEKIVRERTAQALAKKAQWKRPQIQIEIDKALTGLTFEEESSAWERATDRIRTALSEPSARTELAQAINQAKVAQLHNQAIDTEADKALRELELRIGVAPHETNAIQQESTPITEIDKELAEPGAKTFDKSETQTPDEAEPETK